MNNQFEKKDALMEKLIACTKSENYKIRAAAYTALGNFVDLDGVLSKIKEGLKDTHSEVRNLQWKKRNRIFSKVALWNWIT